MASHGLTCSIGLLINVKKFYTFWFDFFHRYPFFTWILHESQALPYPHLKELPHIHLSGAYTSNFSSSWQFDLLELGAAKEWAWGRACLVEPSLCHSHSPCSYYQNEVLIESLHQLQTWYMAYQDRSLFKVYKLPVMSQPSFLQWHHRASWNAINTTVSL